MLLRKERRKKGGYLVNQNNIEVDAVIPTRLDRYLKRLYPALTQGIIEQGLRKGEIKVNNEKTAASRRVIKGDYVSLATAPTKLEGEQENAKTVVISNDKAAASLAKKLLKDYLIYEDENLLAINKPSGLATQGGSKVNISVADALAFFNRQGKRSHNEQYRLTHRLDKETSGILLIAKNYLASVKLTKGFEDKDISKKYLAVTYGAPAETEGEISSYISKSKAGVFEKMQEDNSSGKLAITKYKILHKANGLALIEFCPITGRMHQLRFHAKQLGCPIVGDQKYGEPLRRQDLNSNLPAPEVENLHLLLHAKEITISQEIFNKPVMVKAQIPEYFSKFFPV